jgi:hypothetical protein
MENISKIADAGSADTLQHTMAQEVCRDDDPRERRGGLAGDRCRDDRTVRGDTAMNDRYQKSWNSVPPYDEFMGHYLRYLDRLKAPEISWEEWANRYGSLTDQVLYLDSPIVGVTDPHFIWTECFDSEEGLVVLPGFEIINRSGYWLSERPWQDGDQVLVRIAHPAEEEEEEGEPWNEHVRGQAHKQLRDLVQMVIAACATDYTNCGIDPSDAEHFVSELQRTGTEISEMIARLDAPA